MEKNTYPGSGFWDEHPGHIFEKLVLIFCVRNVLILWCGSRSGIRDLFNHGSGIRDGKNRIRDKHPGSATLPLWVQKSAKSEKYLMASIRSSIHMWKLTLNSHTVLRGFCVSGLQEERADMNNLLYVVTVRLKEKLPSSILSRAPPPPAKNPYLTSDRKATIGEGGIVNSADREAFASFGEEKWRAKFLLKRSIDLDEVSASIIVLAGWWIRILDLDGVSAHFFKWRY
jgi:hypothetical protein